MPELVCLGDCCIDYYLPPVGRGYAGGSAVNVAVAAHAAGLPAACAGALGDDPAGQAVLSLLAARGVDVTHFLPVRGPTRRVPIRVTPDGHQYAHEMMPPRRPFQPTPEMLVFALGASAAHLNWLDDPRQALPALARPGGPRISLDYGARSDSDLLEDTLPYVQIAFFALPAPRAAAAEDLARLAAARGPRLVIVTLAEAGSLAFDSRAAIRQPAVPVDATDSLGAGDSFIGAFLAAHLQNLPLEACLAAASAAAARACTVPGGWPGAEIDPAILEREEYPWR